MQAVYLFKKNSSQQQSKRLLNQLKTSFPFIDTLPVLQALQFYLLNEIEEKTNINSKHFHPCFPTRKQLAGK